MLYFRFFPTSRNMTVTTHARTHAQIKNAHARTHALNVISRNVETLRVSEHNKRFY